MKETPTPAMAAGIAAGKAWASPSDGDWQSAIGIAHMRDVALLRSWCSQLIEDEIWDYSSVYACILTNKLVIDNTPEPGDQLFLAHEEASYAALEFWREVPGWPDDHNEWWSFVEGFVRGVAGDETKP
jgi:hypothetical protein